MTRNIKNANFNSMTICSSSYTNCDNESRIKFKLHKTLFKHLAQITHMIPDNTSAEEHLLETKSAQNSQRSHAIHNILNGHNGESGADRCEGCANRIPLQLRESQLREETHLSDSGTCAVRRLWKGKRRFLLGMPEGLRSQVLQRVYGKARIPQVDGAIVDVSMHGPGKVAVCLAAGLSGQW